MTDELTVDEAINAIIVSTVDKVLPIALGGRTVVALRMLEDYLGEFGIQAGGPAWRRNFTRRIGLTANDLKRKNWYERHQNDLETGRKYSDHKALLTAYAKSLVDFQRGVRPVAA